MRRAVVAAAALVHLVVLHAAAWGEARQVHERFQARIPVAELPAFVAASGGAGETAASLQANLAPLLVPRPSGSTANAAVRQRIADEFKSLGSDGGDKKKGRDQKKSSDTTGKWHLEHDPFTAETPIGNVAFNSLVATKDPAAPRRMTLAAHFDSKRFTDMEFVGASDSAVPCAILIDVARSLNRMLDRKMQSGDRFATLQIIFFDGEEAFVSWTDRDSIYGAKHLAAKWAERRVAISSAAGDPYGAKNPVAAIVAPQDVYYTSPLAQIDMFVLLDLLGPAGISIPNSHPESQWAWDRLVDIQQRLVDAGLASKELATRVRNQQDGGLFQPGHSQFVGPSDIQDDHMPFYEQGVPVLHCIPVPFPEVWHTKNDNAEAISMDSVRDFALIFRIFVAEYLGLV